VYSLKIELIKRSKKHLNGALPTCRRKGREGKEWKEGRETYM